MTNNVLENGQEFTTEPGMYIYDTLVRNDGGNAHLLLYGSSGFQGSPEIEINPIYSCFTETSDVSTKCDIWVIPGFFEFDVTN